MLEYTASTSYIFARELTQRASRKGGGSGYAAILRNPTTSVKNKRNRTSTQDYISASFIANSIIDRGIVG